MIRRHVAVVTGAASGLGEALVRELSRRGSAVALLDVDEARAHGIARALGLGADALVVRCDVTDAAAVDAACDAVYRRWGRCDLLINNAGVEAVGYVGEQGLATWQKLIDTNLFGAVHTLHAFVPRMRRQAGGAAIVNVASMSAYGAFPGDGAHAVSKAALVGLSDTMRAELQPDGIRVITACPGPFRSRLAERFATDDERAHAMLDRFVTRARTSPEEVAAAILRAVDRKRPRVNIGLAARALYRLRTLTPRVLNGVNALMARLDRRRPPA